MPLVTLYTRGSCSMSARAKQLLKTRGVRFVEVDVSADDARFREMVKRAHGAMTTPQVFLGERYLGGFDELERLERQGQLDLMLGRTPGPGAT